MGEFSISVQNLNALVGTASMPAIIDVRRSTVFESDSTVLPTARWRDHAQVDHWARELDSADPVVLYCVHGHQVSQCAAAILRQRGYDVRILAGGIEEWREAAAPLIARAAWPGRTDAGPSRWVTCAAPNAGWVACSWFIRRIIDRQAEILFVDADQVQNTAEEIGVTAYGTKDCELSDADRPGAFDAMLDRFEVGDPALRRMAAIVRGAGSGACESPPESAGFRAMSQGLTPWIGNDTEVLSRALVLGDALFAWCRQSEDGSSGHPAHGGAA